MGLREDMEEEWEAESWKLGVQDITLRIDDLDLESVNAAVAMAQRMMRLDGESFLSNGKGDLKARYLGEICRHYIQCIGPLDEKRRAGRK